MDFVRNSLLDFDATIHWRVIRRDTIIDFDAAVDKDVDEEVDATIIDFDATIIDFDAAIIDFDATILCQYYFTHRQITNYIDIDTTIILTSTQQLYWHRHNNYIDIDATIILTSTQEFQRKNY